MQRKNPAVTTFYGFMSVNLFLVRRLAANPGKSVTLIEIFYFLKLLREKKQGYLAKALCKSTTSFEILHYMSVAA